jgi:hypothetical protein
MAIKKGNLSAWKSMAIDFGCSVQMKVQHDGPILIGSKGRFDESGRLAAHTTKFWGWVWIDKSPFLP